MKKPLKLPRFKTEDSERRFWAKIDLADYFEARDFQAVSFPNLKPSSRAISLRLPEPMILRLKERANERHVPYQSLIKQFIADGLKAG
jgi:predicted DNA binding CopG/RHH family protein